MLGKYLSVSALFIIIALCAGPSVQAAPAPLHHPGTDPGPLPIPVASAPRISRNVEYRYVTIEQFRATAEAVGWGDELDRLTRVALCEAGASSDGFTLDLIDTMAESPWGDRGAMQVNRVHAWSGGIIEAMGYDWDSMLVLAPNLRVALAIRERDGWRPWACR